MDAVTKKARSRLGVFTTFLGTASGRTGFLGGAITEVGIPQARADSSPPAAYVTDVPLWQRLFDAWYAAADDAGLWVFPWSSGPQWGDYNLAIHSNDSSYTSTGTNIDKMFSPGALDIVEAHPTPVGKGYQRGVNLAGPEFGHKQPSFTNSNPGTFGVDYYFPTAGDIAVMAARRIKAVRLPISWERLQPTLLGALDTTYLGRITAVADACLANGVGLIIDLHNYARYEYNDAGTKKVLVLRQANGIDLNNPGPTTDTENPTQSDAGKIGPDYLIDVWRRLSNVYRTHRGVLAYEIMNEPHDVASSAGSFSGATLNDWNAGTTAGWSGGIGVTLAHTTTTPYEGSGALRASGTTASGGGFTAFRAERGSVSGTGNVLRGRVRLNGSPTGTWQARFEWQNASFAWQSANAVNLTAGQWVEVACDFSGNAIAGNAINLAVQVHSSNPASSQAVTFDLDLFERGSMTGVYTDITAWENITQQVLTDLRSRPDNTALRDTKTVLIPGMGWNVLGWNHSTAWLTEPSGLEGTHLYVTHHYFDSTSTGVGEGEGVYQTSNKRYADAQTYALAQSFTNDADTTLPTITVAPTVGSITGTNATVTWQTSEACDRRVEYGIDNSLTPEVFGSTTVRQTNLLTTHSVTLYGLTPGATYKYRVWNRDSAGNYVSSSSATFISSPPSSFNSYILSLNPGLYWRLGETTGTLTAEDSSGNSRHGIYNDFAGTGAALTWGVAGPLSGDSSTGVRFGESDGWAERGNASVVIANQSNVTLGMLINIPAGDHGWAGVAGVRGWTGSAEKGFWIQRQGGGGNQVDIHYAGQTGSPHYATNISLTTGVWHSLIATMRLTDGELMVYVDGFPMNVNINTPSSPITDTNLPFQAGRLNYQHNGAGSAWNLGGQTVLKDVFVLPKALTGKQVRDLWDRVPQTLRTTVTPARLRAGRWIGGHTEYNLDQIGANTELDQHIVRVNRTPEGASTFQGWGDTANGFPAREFDNVYARNMLPMVTWEPWVSGGGLNQTSFQLADILAGNYNTYIDAWATAARDYGEPFLLRFMHEHNGNGWFPWQEGYNGNTAGQFIAAWRYVVNRFRALDAGNAIWVWNPNIDPNSPSSGWSTYAGTYPGDDYVDWIGLDGYNWGTDAGGAWETFSQVFLASYNRIVAVAPNKPLLIGETASSPTGGTKATWITDAYTVQVPQNMPKIRGIYWFDLNKERDWRINSSSPTLTAYQGAVALNSAYYSESSLSRQVAANAALSRLSNTRQIGISAALSRASLTRQVSANATVSYTGTTRTVATSAAIMRLSLTRQLASSVSVGTSLSRTISGTAAVRATLTRTTAPAAALSRLGTTRQVASTAYLAVAGTVTASRFVTASAPLRKTSTRVIASSANISNPSDASTPSAPSALEPSVVLSNGVVLRWEEASANETGFEVQWSEDGVTWLYLATLGANATGYTDTSAYPGQRRYYRVRAFRIA